MLVNHQNWIRCMCKSGAAGVGQTQKWLWFCINTDYHHIHSFCLSVDHQISFESTIWGLNANCLCAEARSFGAFIANAASVTYNLPLLTDVPINYDSRKFSETKWPTLSDGAITTHWHFWQCQKEIILSCKYITMSNWGIRKPCAHFSESLFFLSNQDKNTF